MLRFQVNKLPFFIQVQTKPWWREQRPLFQCGSAEPIWSAGPRGCEVEQLNSARGAATVDVTHSRQRTRLAFRLCTENAHAASNSLSTTDFPCIICIGKDLFFFNYFWLKSGEGRHLSNRWKLRTLNCILLRPSKEKDLPVVLPLNPTKGRWPNKFSPKPF